METKRIGFFVNDRRVRERSRVWSKDGRLQEKKRKSEEGGSVVNYSRRRGRRKSRGRKTPRLTRRDPSLLLISSLPFIPGFRGAT